MNVQLTPDQKAFVQRAIARNSARSRSRSSQRASASCTAASSEGRRPLEVTLDSMRQLAAEVKQRGRARLLAELNASR